MLHEEIVTGLVDVRRPPDHKEWGVTAHVDESNYEEIKYWISKGAQVKGLNLRKMLLENQWDLPNCEEQFWDGKWMMTLETYNQLKEIGATIERSDFEIIDWSKDEFALVVFQYAERWYKRDS